MGNMHLVTGYAGQEHITATDQAAFNAALIGTGQFVLGKGKVFEAQIISNNQIRILDGELMMQGRFVRLDPDTYVDLAIDNGTQGKKRNDIVVARYTKNSVTGVEEVSVAIIKGTVVDSNPSDPTHTEADITNGAATLHEYPLWRIPLDGLNVGEPVSLFGEPFIDSMRTLPEIRKTVNTIQGSVDNQLAEWDEEVDGKIAKIESYTKEETFSNATKRLYGIGSDGVPDDVFGILSRFPSSLCNEYVWEKFACSSYKDFGTHTINSDYRIYSNTNYSKTFYYADSYNIGDNLKVSLVSPQSFVMTGDTAYDDSSYDVLRGKYLLSDNSTYQNGDSVIFIPSDAVLYTTGQGMSFYATFTPVESYTNPRLVEERESLGFVNSPDPSAYPINDGFIYASLGKLGEKVKVASGSYKGTGTSGVNGKTQITLPFLPKLVFVVTGGGIVTVFTEGVNATKHANEYSSSYYDLVVAWSGNTVSWYSSESQGGATYQLNSNNATYKYVAIA